MSGPWRATLSIACCPSLRTQRKATDASERGRYDASESRIWIAIPNPRDFVVSFVVESRGLFGTRMATMRVFYVDFICLGEYEEVFLTLVQALRDALPVCEVKGVAWRDADNLPRVNERAPMIEPLDDLPPPARHLFPAYFDHDMSVELLRGNKRAPIMYVDPIDALPFPAYDLVDLGRYHELASKGFSPRFREWGDRPITMLTSRGCPHRCTFCSIQSTMGYEFRYHSPAYVKRHIDFLVQNHGVDFIHFEDDNFTHIPARYDEIIDHLITLDPKVKWDTPNGVRGDTWTLERIRRAKASGCQFLTVAIESSVPDVLDKIVRKRLDLDRAREMIRDCDRAGLRLHAFYIIGFPGETLDDMQRTVDFALDNYRRYGTTPFQQPLILIPGTDVHAHWARVRFEPRARSIDGAGLRGDLSGSIRTRYHCDGRHETVAPILLLARRARSGCAASDCAGSHGAGRSRRL